MRSSLLSASAFILLTACTWDGTVLLKDNDLYTLRHPKEWSATHAVTMPEEGYQAAETTLTYPARKDRTTLTEATMQITLSSLCPSLENIDITGDVTTAMIGGKAWQRVSYDDVGAGNRYQGDAYMLMYKNVCYAITTKMHSCNLGPDCEEGHTEPFDKAKMDEAFDTILSTFTFLE